MHRNGCDRDLGLHGRVSCPARVRKAVNGEAITATPAARNTRPSIRSTRTTSRSFESCGDARPLIHARGQRSQASNPTEFPCDAADGQWRSVCPKRSRARRGIRSGDGKDRWVQEPFAPGELEGDSTRGVAYWTDGRDERILAQRGEYLYTLNVEDRKELSQLRRPGRVNLTSGLGPIMAKYYWTGAPLVIRDVVIIGASMTDSPGSKDQPRGDVRAFDVRTGALRWQFHVIPQAGEFGMKTGRTTPGGIQARRRCGHCSVPTKSSATCTCP